MAQAFMTTWEAILQALGASLISSFLGPSPAPNTKVPATGNRPLTGCTPATDKRLALQHGLFLRLLPMRGSDPLAAHLPGGGGALASHRLSASRNKTNWKNPANQLTPSLFRPCDTSR